MAGSKAKLEAALKGRDVVDIANQNRPAEYHLRPVGQMVSPVQGTSLTHAAILSGMGGQAYKKAKDGGTHKNWYKSYLKLGDTQITKGINSLMQQVEDHQRWIQNPGIKVKDWDKRDERYKTGLIRKWNKDIARQMQQIDILRGILHERHKE